MQHLPVPATGAAHSLDGWYHRGSPPSLHARLRFWPAKWGRSQNAAVDFHFPHHFILSEFRRKWTHVQNTIHCEPWSSWIFFIICISELYNLFFFRCFLHGPCEREDALHLLHCISILLKCEVKGLYTETNVSESTRWSFVVVFPFVLVMLPNICNVNHQYSEGEKWM